MSMRLGCCCGGTDPCSVCDADANICCLKITRVSGVGPGTTFVRPWYMQSSADCPDTPWTNMCGQKVWSRAVCSLPTVGIQWRPVEGDCDNVIFHLGFERTRYYSACTDADIPEANITFSAPKNWYTGVLTRTIGGETITIEPCTWGTVSDIYDATNIEDDIILSFAWEDEWVPGTRWITSAGTRLCGSQVCSSSDFNGTIFAWRYNLASDTIDFYIEQNFENQGCPSLPYDNGNWVNNLDSLVFGNPTARMAVVDTCESPPPPPPNDQCLEDAATGVITLDFTFTVDGTECSNWDAPLGPHSITAGTPWEYVSDATHYISKMTLILDNLSPGIEARLKILYTDDPDNFAVNGIEYTGVVDGECIDGQFFGTVEFTGPICASSSTAPVVTIDFTGPP